MLQPALAWRKRVASWPVYDVGTKVFVVHQEVSVRRIHTSYGAAWNRPAWISGRTKVAVPVSRKRNGRTREVDGYELTFTRGGQTDVSQALPWEAGVVENVVSIARWVKPKQEAVATLDQMEVRLRALESVLESREQKAGKPQRKDRP